MDNARPVARPDLRPAGAREGAPWFRRRGLPALGFLAVSLALTLGMFWPAATGRALLAPLDLAPNLFSKFKYVDPAATGVPANHYVIDLLLGDVSRNRLVHEAWRRGEMPWWDPYTEAGRPLAAEANAINVSDPFKVLLFHLLPFEAAYNWVRIVTFLVSGVGAFLLLRHFGFCFSACAWGALLYQFAGCNAMMFSGPTVQAVFSYFPLLWLLWDKAATDGKFFWFAASAPVCGVIFLSGNLQSHTYPFLLAAGFVLGSGWGRRRRFVFLAAGTAFALALGLALAAPFVLSQIEMFLRSIRKVSPGMPTAEMFSGALSAVTIFPWAIGTFRTLDAGKVIGQNSLGFWVYIGSAALVIAMLGALVPRAAGSPERDRKRVALALIAIYLLVCSTPLLRLFYTRTAWLAVLGLVVFFAMGWQRLLALDSPLKRCGRVVIGLALALALVTNLGGLVLYPKMQAKIEAFVLKKQATNPSLDEATALRKFQVANFPNEVTFRNREPLLAFLGLIALGVYLVRPPAARRRVWLAGILVLSSLPLLWFVQRYIPQHPIELWHRIRAGGPEQQRVVAAVKERGLRLREDAPGQHEWLFPGATAQLFGVHSMQGHSSLMLAFAAHVTNAAGGPDPSLHDALYRSATRGLERGELEVKPGFSRYRWAAPSDRPVSIAAETLNSITLALGPGPAGELIRTDTWYPGWRVAPETPGVTMTFEPPCFARLMVPESVRQVRLVYEPRWLRAGIWIAAAGAVLIGCSLLASRPRRTAAPS